LLSSSLSPETAILSDQRSEKSKDLWLLVAPFTQHKQWVPPVPRLWGPGSTNPIAKSKRKKAPLENFQILFKPGLLFLLE
jgi:hypothetical protein